MKSGKEVSDFIRFSISEGLKEISEQMHNHQDTEEQ